MAALTKIQEVFGFGWEEYCSSHEPSEVQWQAAQSIMDCKSGKLGYSISVCKECGHIEIHNNSCRNRNCPNCQAVLNELWVDKRRSEVIDGPYFHVVFTVPAQLNPIIYANQREMYSAIHRCAAETLLELSSNPKFLGATPGIIQVLHTWGQELNYHPHIHCIISGTGLSADGKLKTCGKHFFLPARALAKKFRGKLLAATDSLYQSGKLSLYGSCGKLRNRYEWDEFRDSLYHKEWSPDIRDTFNGFGNAIDYLGRYTHCIAISNARIINVTEDSVTFTAKDYRNGSAKKEITLSNKEFIRRFMMHVLPYGFQKIRYYGFLCNRSKKKNLELIFRLQGHQRYKSMLKGLSMDEVLMRLWKHDVTICPVCGCRGMQHAGRVYPLRN
ncbi:MAG: IS91 family transposase [Clostridiales bacterium]|nr:IS91 family transposase [Clostridiales bacterium]